MQINRSGVVDDPGIGETRSVPHVSLQSEDKLWHRHLIELSGFQLEA
jgi:hypothetical protein